MCMLGKFVLKEEWLNRNKLESEYGHGIVEVDLKADCTSMWFKF